MSIASMFYRTAARMMFAPFGGLGTMRSRLIDALDLRAGTSVLELGCGPGDITLAMLLRGAHVHAVDASSDMLRAAAKRAPGAQFERANIRSFTPTTRYDVVLLAFVLHELRTEDIGLIMRMAASAVSPSGRIAILDHAIPSGNAGRIWRRVLGFIESAEIERWFALDLAHEARGAGLTVSLDEELAGGRARLLVTNPTKARAASSILAV
jgi:2-polyprenyl-3-methyl-5-hydroxy-6-metoxy-1,4-benzoquinol methylase